MKSCNHEMIRLNSTAEEGCRIKQDGLNQLRDASILVRLRQRARSIVGHNLHWTTC